MYSMVLMMALGGGAATPAACHGCWGGGGGGCHGGWSAGCHGGGWRGCNGGGLFGRHGCYSGGGCYASSGCNGGGHRCFGGLFGRHGCHGGGNGCYASGGCYGGRGCHGGVIYHGGHGCHGGKAAPAGAAPEQIPAPPTKTKEARASRSATLVVSLPAEAKLTIDGTPTTSTSASRVFVTPELGEGNYAYTLQAELTRDGQAVTTSERVTVRAGQETRVALEFPTEGIVQR